MNKLIYILIIITTFSCKTPKTVYKNVEIHDTIQTNTVLRVTQPRLTNLVLDSPCDSLGVLKPFIYETKTPTKTISIKTKDNKLVITEKQDSIIEKDVEHKEISTSISDEIKVITKTPKWAWYSLILNVLLMVWTLRKIIKPLL